jgi:hypothetical protein
MRQQEFQNKKDEQRPHLYPDVAVMLALYRMEL